MNSSWGAVNRARPYYAKKLKKRKDKQRPVIEAKKKRLRKIMDAFYDSREWKTLRYQALKLHGAKCQLCGITRADGAQLNVDHIKPRSRYPELALEIDNLQVLCAWCNTGKGAWDQTDWRTF